MPDGKVLTVDGPPNNFPTAGVYAKVINAYPHIKKELIFLTNKDGVILAPNKTIAQNGISQHNV